MLAHKNKGDGLCPVSFGLAAGITYALVMLAMALMILMGLAPPQMVALKASITVSVVAMHMFWALVQGFVCGFVLAAIYDLILCCGCGKKSDGSWGWCCSMGKKKGKK